MKIRSNEEELLDDPNVRPEELLHTLNFMRQINELFGGTRSVLDYFAGQKLPDSFSVLDIGSGGGDIPFALAKWAKAQDKRVHITAIDLQPLCVVYAAKNFSSPDILHLEHSAFNIGDLGKFDFIISSMFFHHLSDNEIVRLLGLMQKTARIGWLVNDLYRGSLNYAGAWFLGTLSGRAIVFNDAKLSVARAFREADLERYCAEAGLSGATIRRRPIFRITMNGHGQG